MECHYCNITDKKTLLYENASYLALLNKEDQQYLGRTVVFLKNHKSDLSDLTDKEWLDFKDVCQKLENAFRKSFDATMFNWTCLVNNSYKNKPYNAHLHWHLRPRYDHEVNVDGTLFIDPNFGEHYERKTNKSISNEVQQYILNVVKANI